MPSRTAILPLLVVALGAGPLDASAAPKGRPSAPPVPVVAQIVPDGSLGEVCRADCMRNVLAKVRGRRGVKKATLVGDAVALEVQAGVFRAEDVIRGLDGLRIEMTLPYKAVELRFAAGVPFPPASRLDGETLVVELGDDVRKAIEDATRFRPFDKMKCLGRLGGPQENEAVLSRFETEKRAPVTMVPFLAEADLDGDRRPDLYMRLAGLPELVIFNRAGGLKAVPVQKVTGDEEIPRCEQRPTRFARPVARSKVKCMGLGTIRYDGDAIERVEFNRSNELLMWNKGSFVTCEPLGEGALPPLPPKPEAEGEESAE